jgi:hypothetical protein
MNKIIVALEEKELIRIKRILADGDECEALRFVQEVLEPRVKEAELPHCVPAFEASYRPHQGECFTTGT